MNVFDTRTHRKKFTNLGNVKEYVKHRFKVSQIYINHKHVAQFFLLTTIDIPFKFEINRIFQLVTKWEFGNST